MLPLDLESAILRIIEGPSEHHERTLAELCVAHPQHADAILAHAAAVQRENPEAKIDPTDASSPPRFDAPPKQIGPYRILEALGEGGMGVVYAAEQRQAIFRRVALKVIKIGMDTKEVLARFEAERQALALLDHPNIARVLDAGATSGGRPYFAMELVRGLSITRYCDESRLSVSDRVEVLLQACAALQHSHERGIIHRDIKPSNLMVTEVDGKPVVKVIDFGLAKAINQRLTERTLFTEEGRIIGTPEYMSPEQAETSAQDVDARSDVFSLGVVLYELLAGALPFDFKMAREKGYFEVQRLIREEEAPTPRRRLSGLKHSLDQILALRRCRLQELAGSLRDGLDAVTMKAIAKQRRDRYSSSAELAADLRRFLAGEPVLARKTSGMGSLLVRMRRLRRRNPAIVPAVLVASVAVGGMWWLTSEDTGPTAPPAPHHSQEPASGGSRKLEIGPPRTYLNVYRDYHALLIGVGRYSDAMWPDLGTPVREVRAVENRLQGIDVGWRREGAITVLVDTEATSARILEELDRIRNQAGPDDAVLLYFVGHGIRIGRDYCLVAADAEGVDPRLGRGFVQSSQITSFLDECGAKHVLTILDCCSAGALFYSGTGRTEAVGDYARAVMHQVRQIITAVHRMEVADGRDLPLFCKAFVDALDPRNGPFAGRSFVDAGALFGHILNEIANAPAEVGRSQGLQFTTLQGEGSFVFFLRAK